MMANQLLASRVASAASRTTTATAVRALSSLTKTGDNSISNDSYVSPFKEFFGLVETNNTPFSNLDFEPDKKYLKSGIAEDALRFKTETYGRLQLAPYLQPMEHKVSVRIAMRDLNLSSPLERKLVTEIVGSRLTNDTLQLSSNQFGSRIENKRHLVSMLDRIVLGAKRLAKELEATNDESTGAEESSS